MNEVNGKLLKKGVLGLMMCLWRYVWIKVLK